MPYSKTKKNRDFYRVVSGAYGEALGLLHLDSRTVEWKGLGLSQLLGHGPDDLRLDLDDLPHLTHAEDRDLFQQALDRVANGNPVELEFRLVDHAGHARWFHFTAAKGRTEGVMGLALQDVHERRSQIDAQVEQRRFHGLETLAAGIAHEFNNLLTPVRGHVELAMAGLSATHPSREGLATALRQIDRCADLVEMIQHSGRKAVLHRRRSDLRGVIAASLRLAQSLSTSRAPLTFSFRAAEPLPDVLADQACVRLALMHLLRNAASALPQGGEISVTARVLDTGLESQEEADFVEICVQDPGVGIRPEDLAFIFDPFFTTRGRAEARGLGLSMVQGIVEQHGGWVQAHSKPGHGTQIKMFLPIWKESAQVPPAESPGAEPRARKRPHPSVLLCVARKSIRLLAARVLDEQGWRVTETDTLPDATACLEAGGCRIDLAILDAALIHPPSAEAVSLLLSRLTRPRLLLMHASAQDPLWAAFAGRAGIAFAGPAFSPRDLLVASARLID